MSDSCSTANRPNCLPKYLGGCTLTGTEYSKQGCDPKMHSQCRVPARQKKNALSDSSNARNVCDEIKNDSIDILYIDGDHSYEAVLQDLKLYYDKVKKGGLIIGDDYNEEGVRTAIEKFSQMKKITYHTSHNDDTDKFWFNK